MKDNMGGRDSIAGADGAASRDSMEEAYSFFHQKWNVYRGSTDERQRDDIEYAVGAYASGMDGRVYAQLSAGRAGFLMEHASFAADLQEAVDVLERMTV